MLPDSMNTHPTQKTGVADHQEDIFGGSSSKRGGGPSLDQSAAMPEYDQLPEHCGDEYKSQSMTANPVGKLGVKIQKLPNLPGQVVRDARTDFKGNQVRKSNPLNS